MMLFCFLLNSIYNQRDTLSKYDYLAVNCHYYETYLSFYIVIQCLLDNFPFIFVDRIYYKIKIFFEFGLTLLLFCYSLKKFVYKKFQIQRLLIYCLGILLSFDFGLMMPEIVQRNSNYFVFYFIAALIFNHLINRKIVLMTAILSVYVSKKLKTKNHKLFMNIMISCFIPSDDHIEHKLLAKGMMMHHFECCTLVNCFCKQDVIYDCKKSKNVMIQKTKGSGFHFKCYIKQILQINDTPKDFNKAEWHIDFAEFMYRKFRNVFIAKFHLERAEETFSGTYQKFRIYRLKRLIKEWVRP